MHTHSHARACRLTGIGVGIGLAFGLATGWVLRFVRWRGVPAYVEALLTLTIAYLAFYTAQSPAEVIWGCWGQLRVDTALKSVTHAVVSWQENSVFFCQYVCSEPFLPPFHPPTLPTGFWRGVHLRPGSVRCRNQPLGHAGRRRLLRRTRGSVGFGRVCSKRPNLLLGGHCRSQLCCQASPGG
jgi:hypothetical protein